MFTVSAKVSETVVQKLDVLAGKLSCTRGEFVRYLIGAAVGNPDVADDLLAAEKEKQQRLIRNIMSTYGNMF
jgi:hypothetical protein